MMTNLFEDVHAHAKEGSEKLGSSRIRYIIVKIKGVLNI